MKTTKFFWMAAAVGGWSATASAQSQTLGFPIGEKSRIHTNLDLGVAFDSNPARYDDDNPDAQSDWRGLIRPGLLVVVPGTSLSMNLRSQLSIHQYFGVNGESDTLFGGNVGLKFAAGSKTSAISFFIDDTLVRTPAYLDELGTVASDEIRFKEWSNRGKVGFTLRPGGGALEFDVGYLNVLSFYDSLPSSQRHGALFEARYKFLPKTAVVFSSDWSFFDPDDEGGTLLSAPYNLMLSLIGQITSRITAHLGAGFGDTLTWEGEHFSSVAERNARTVIATGRLGYAFSDRFGVSAGYDRRLAPVILLNNYVSDSFNLTMNFAITSRLQFRLYGEYELRSYGDVADRNAQLLVGDARVEYWFFDFLNAGLAYRVLMQRADDNPAVANVPFLEDYIRHQAFLNVGLRY